jgi:hypothetical protein
LLLLKRLSIGLAHGKVGGVLQLMNLFSIAFFYFVLNWETFKMKKSMDWDFFVFPNFHEADENGVANGAPLAFSIG